MEPVYFQAYLVVANIFTELVKYKNSSDSCSGESLTHTFLHTYFLCSSIVYSLLLSSITEDKIVHKCMKKVKHNQDKKKHNQNLIKITHVQYLFQNVAIHFNT